MSAIKKNIALDWNVAILLFIIILSYSFVTLIAGEPAYWGTPDIQYVKAKIIRVSQGNLFTDPVTGVVNFHPPYYHMILSVFYKLGIDLDSLLYFISILNTSLTIIIVFFIGNFLWGKSIGLQLAALTPFIQEFLGPGYLFLATSFYFSLPIYLSGLYLYLRRNNPIFWGVIWGIAFLISPIYVFIILLTFIFEAFFVREYKYFLTGLTAFAITASPFLVHAYIIYSSGLEGTSSFAFIRGLTHLKDIIPQTWVGWIGYLIFILAGSTLYFYRKIHYFFYLSIIGSIVTAYHFNPDYATRIVFIASLFIIGHAIYVIRRRKALLLISLVLALSLGYYLNLGKLIKSYESDQEIAPVYHRQNRLFLKNFGKHVEPNCFVLANCDTYRYNIMPYLPNYGLVAYKTGEYFQLNSEIAHEMLRDYNSIFSASNIETINRICRKYDIRQAVIYGNRDLARPAFRLLTKHWKTVYQDSHFMIIDRGA